MWTPYNCPFWDELWLNEAFASYITYVGLEESDNEVLAWDADTKVGTWDLGVQVITGRLPAALSADQTILSNPVANQEWTYFEFLSRKISLFYYKVSFCMLRCLNIFSIHDQSDKI